MFIKLYSTALIFFYIQQIQSFIFVFIEWFLCIKLLLCSLTASDSNLDLITRNTPFFISFIWLSRISIKFLLFLYYIYHAFLLIFFLVKFLAILTFTKKQTLKLWLRIIFIIILAHNSETANYQQKVWKHSKTVGKVTKVYILFIEKNELFPLVCD